jgi:LEA14-like dessication related protein
MKKYFFILFISCCIAFIACKDFQEINFSGIDNVNVTSLSQKGAEAIVTARIKNPNNVGFTIYKSEMDVTIDGINAGKAHLTKSIRIKANSEETYMFKIESDFSNLSIADMPKIMEMAMSKHVMVGLKGNLKVGKLFVKHSVPVDITKDVPLDGM